MIWKVQSFRGFLYYPNLPSQLLTIFVHTLLSGSVDISSHVHYIIMFGCCSLAFLLFCVLVYLIGGQRPGGALNCRLWIMVIWVKPKQSSSRKGGKLIKYRRKGFNNGHITESDAQSKVRKGKHPLAGTSRLSVSSLFSLKIDDWGFGCFCGEEKESKRVLSVLELSWYILQYERLSLKGQIHHDLWSSRNRQLFVTCF